MMNSKLRELYKKLLQESYNKETPVYKMLGETGGLTAYKAFKGNEFDDPANKVRLMVVGRAMNGWEERFENCDTIGKCIDVIDNNQFDFTKDVIEAKTDGYSYRRSAFWRAIHQVLKVFGEATDDWYKSGWEQKIVWSNICKVSPWKSGNPDDKLFVSQKGICRDILKAEIEEFKPSHILFMTGWEYWGESFLKDMNLDVKGRNICRGEEKNNVFVEAAGVYLDIPVIVACRPELRPTEDYVEQIFIVFKEMNKRK